MIRSFPSSIWKLDKKDFILFSFSFLVNILVIITINPEIFSKKSDYKKNKFLFYQDGIISIHFAKNSFTEKKNRDSPASTFCSPLQFHGMFIRPFISLFSHLFILMDKDNAVGNNLKQIMARSALFGQISSIFISSFIVCYVFRRLISIFHLCDYQTQNAGSISTHNKNIISSNPFIITILLSVFPARFTLLRSCPTSDSLFFALVCFSIIFFNVSNLISTFLFHLAFFAALMTRYEGVVLIPIFLIICVFKLVSFFFNKFANEGTKNVKVSKSNTSNEANDKISDIEDNLYDDNSANFLISLSLKFASIITCSIIYYFLFMNYSEIPFTIKDFITHLIFPYQLQDEKTDQKGNNGNGISYPFSLLLKNVGTINTLRQAHSVFSLFLPLLFCGFLLITTTSSSPSDEENKKENEKPKQSEMQNDNHQKAKTNPKEEKVQPRQWQKQKYNSNKFKGARNLNKGNFSPEQSQNQNQTNKNENDEDKKQDSLIKMTFSPYYQKVTADFLRQVGVLVLAYAISASCLSTAAVFRILVTAEAFAYPIVAERLVKHFLQLLFSTSSFINLKQQNHKKSDDDGNEDNDDMKKLNLIALTEKIVFIGGSLLFLSALIAWDCFYSRREIHRYSFTPNLWYSIVTN